MIELRICNRYNIMEWIIHGVDNSLQMYDFTCFYFVYTALTNIHTLLCDLLFVLD